MQEGLYAGNRIEDACKHPVCRQCGLFIVLRLINVYPAPRRSPTSVGWEDARQPLAIRRPVHDTEERNTMVYKASVALCPSAELSKHATSTNSVFVEVELALTESRGGLRSSHISGNTKSGLLPRRRSPRWRSSLRCMNRIPRLCCPFTRRRRTSLASLD